MQQAKVGKDMGYAYGAGYPGLRSLRDFPPGLPTADSPRPQ